MRRNRPYASRACREPHVSPANAAAMQLKPIATPPTKTMGSTDSAKAAKLPDKMPATIVKG